jgi:hypothetical protein
MDQESEGTSVVIFVVCGAVVLLLLLGGGAFFFLMRAEGMPDTAPVVEPPAVEVHEEGPIHVGPGANDEPTRPKVMPINKEPPKPVEGPKGPPAPEK